MLSFPPRKGGIPLAWRWLAGRLPGRLAGRLVGRLPEVGREIAREVRPARLDFIFLC